MGRHAGENLSSLTGESSGAAWRRWISVGLHQSIRDQIDFRVVRAFEVLGFRFEMMQILVGTDQVKDLHPITAYLPDQISEQGERIDFVPVASSKENAACKPVHGS